jgi:DNA-directed RNA polymerase specialized sigma subunit
MREHEEHLDWLALKAQAGSEEALGELVERFRRVIKQIAIDVALRWHGHRVAHLEEELYQEGMIGLLLGAVRNYDPAKGPFRPWAVKHIKWAVRRAVYKLHGLEPREARAVLQALAALRQEGVDNPSVDEIAHRTGLPVDKVSAVLAVLNTQVVGEDELAARPEDASFEDVTADHPSVLLVLQVSRELGRDGFKFVELHLLRDMGYEWYEIADLLSRAQPPNWINELQEEYPAVLEVFPEINNWHRVQEAFRTQALTADALRQFYCRFQQRIRPLRLR